jgi:ATP-dependent helicase/DNAse subunit B
VRVTVSLPFEPGRLAFKAIAEVHTALAGLADEHLQLEAVSDHYADESRAALHHLERSLFEDDTGEAAPAGATVAQHAAGGVRAEVELVGAEVLRLLRAGTAPGDVAVVFRDPQRYASVVEQVFEAYGIPFSIGRRVRLEHTGLGRGLLALLRCATDGGARAEDLLAYLRTPGKLRLPELADRVEAEARRRGARSAAEAREVWEELNPGFELTEIDRLREASGTRALLECLDAELQRLFAGPHRRQAPVLTGSELEDPRVFRSAHDALRHLHALAESLDRRRVHDTLAELTVRVGETPQPDRVQVASPEAIRARRFEAVFICGLQEGEFPRGAAPEPFLSDDDRRGLAEEGDLVLRVREDQLDRERYLFYICASRAERLLVLSSRYCDEEGDPESPSFFLDDTSSLLSGMATRRRRLSDVAWDPDEAPTADEWGRAVALRGPRSADAQPGPLSEPLVLQWLAERDAVSAGAIERYSDCPVKWLVEDVFRPEALEPDPEAMVRGRFAHEVLQRTFERLREEVGSRGVTADNLDDAERILIEELQNLGPEFRLSPDATRVRSALRRLEFDLVRYLRHESRRDGEFEPAELEYAFETEIDGVTVRGRIDRVDTWDGHALVRDYKSGKTAASYRVDAWETENRLQAPLYMLAAQRELGLEPAGAVYVPLAGEDRRPRGAVVEEVPEVGSDFYGGDRVSREELEAALDRARERLRETSAAMARGELRCTPDSCSFRGGCSYPSICRVEE